MIRVLFIFRHLLKQTNKKQTETLTYAYLSRERPLIWYQRRPPVFFLPCAKIQKQIEILNLMKVRRPPRPPPHPE